MSKRRSLIVYLSVVVILVCLYKYLFLPNDNTTTSFLPSIKNLEKIILYEGLPHQSFERESLKKEKEMKQTINIAGYPFYKKPLELKSGDVGPISKILKLSTTYKPFSGEKKCGGFHPDYAVVFHDKEKQYSILICFGCHEAKLEGPGYSSRHDIARKPYQILEKYLSQYRKNRPIVKF